MTEPTSRIPTVTHWGAYDAEVSDGRVTALHPAADDPHPSPIGPGMAEALDHPSRIRQPMVRKAWLDGTSGRRGAGPFVALDWDRAVGLVADEIERVRREKGNQAIYAGSYGWASAGRFHHALGQVHRFMRLAGGYTDSRDTYSLAAGEVVLPHIVGMDVWSYMGACTSFQTVAEAGGLLVSFGGVPLKNAQIAGGGLAKHWLEDAFGVAAGNGVRFVNFGPTREDMPGFVDVTWHRNRPNTDVAVMLGLAHTLVAEGLHDVDFLARCTIGFDRFLPYLMGETDGTPKDADWAATIAGLDAEAIRGLATQMAATRTMINLSWSVQRADHGEQTFWMGITLAAMLGQIGLPGGGFTLGYGAVGTLGAPVAKLRRPTFPQPPNPVDRFIPVSRIADMLLNPGAEIDYNGRRLTYPEISLIYWCGGNPFHHHQDLNRLTDAWQRPETVIVHEGWWNANARHADIVLPVTTSLERNDISCNRAEPTILAMKQAIEPIGESRSDYDIFAAIAGRLGFGDQFTEGRSEADWLRHMWDRFRQAAAEQDIEAPGFDDFWAAGRFEAPAPAPQVLFDDFRRDPEAHPLKTPSGKIEIFSETVAAFGYADCPGHPVWLTPAEWLGGDLARRFPLHLISNQPKTRLHSQFDHGGYAQSSKVQGREPVQINPADAAARDIADGDLVRLWNDRGACLAGARVTDAVMAGVVILSTGAWYDPAVPGQPGGLEKHGNPNVLTADRPTSKLAQGPSAQTCLVEIARFEGDPPPLTAFDPPAVEAG